MKTKNAWQDTLLVVALAISACSGESEKSNNSLATAECPQADVADATAITQERADKLIGFTESDAESCATSLGWSFRVGERDGESFAVTADYSQQRVTVSVTNNLVTEVVVG